MTRTRSAVLALAFSTLGLAAPSVVFAAPDDSSSCAQRERGERGHSRHGSRGIGRLVKELGELELTAEQQSLADALEDSRRPERGQRDKEQSPTRLALEAARAGQPIDAAALRADLEQRTSERAAHAQEQLDLALELYASLNEVQRAELGARLEAAGEDGERRGRRGGLRERGGDESTEG